jgi:hypothetical protein
MEGVTEATKYESIRCRGENQYAIDQQYMNSGSEEVTRIVSSQH